MLAYPTLQELFHGDDVAMADLEQDGFIAKGHHDTDQLTVLLRTGDNVPPLMRDLHVAQGTLKTGWALFAWHKPGCDAVGEDRPWCPCGLDEAGARVDWYPTPSDPSTPGAIPVTWFNAAPITAA